MDLNMINDQNTGLRLKEGAAINRSLLALGNCINALAEKKTKYVIIIMIIIIIVINTMIIILIMLTQ